MNDQTALANAASQQAETPLDETTLRNELRALRTQIPDTPSLNPIVSLAFDMSRRLESGQIQYDELRTLAQHLMDRAGTRRARSLRERIAGHRDPAEALKDFKAFVAKTAGPPGLDGLAAFKDRWARTRTGIVLTAHPTFGLSNDLSKHMVDIASGARPSNYEPMGHPHRPKDGGITLDYEHGRAQDAIRHLRDAYFELMNIFFSASAAHFGEQAYTVRPRLATFASWVGYDLDGRTDITWSYSFFKRLEEKKAALADIRVRFHEIKHRLGDNPELQRVTRQVTGKLDLALEAVAKQVQALVALLAQKESLRAAANIITDVGNYNLTSTEPLVALLDQMIGMVEQPQHKRALAALIGLIEATGLGMSHIHARVNAVQLNNAFRAFVHESWTRDLSEEQALTRIVELIASTKEETVNFETLDLETATAIRQFALIAQIKKHVDKETPIRFLIAECESPATVLIAVFFAKLFGVLDIVDISPLFETATGLESGARLIERLLSAKAYRDYVSGRKRLAMQTGFSDAGRFIGQIAATLAVERLHHNLADVMKRANLPDVELLIFSTHGESMGRGAHPGDLPKRLSYVYSEEARRHFARNGQTVKHETSFQGGDGYMFFADKGLTASALATIIMNGADVPEAEDPFYADVNLSLDFLLRLKSYQQHLFAHPGYRAVLGAFGSSLLFKTGSRPVKRQSEGATAADLGDPARMRAIPNNAILQQFGYVANVVAGLGAAVGSERDRFVDLAKRSPRLRLLIEMIARAKQLSSLNALSGNAIVFDPGFWSWRASWGREPHLESAFRALSMHLLHDGRSGAINGLVHHLRVDAIDLHLMLNEIGLEGGKIPDDDRLELDLLQAIRLALIMRVFILAAQLPRFSPRNEIGHEQIFQWVLRLEIPEAVKIMREAFPKRTSAAADSAAFTEQATYLPHGVDDYGRVETEILAPMVDAYEFIREIGTGISHHFGAFG